MVADPRALAEYRADTVRNIDVWYAASHCVYIAPNEDMIREHAKQGGFPAIRISQVKNIIDPTTSEHA